MRPSEEELPERLSGALRHKNTPDYRLYTRIMNFVLPRFRTVYTVRTTDHYQHSDIPLAPLSSARATLTTQSPQWCCG
jgi:hypothetical protein